MSYTPDARIKPYLDHLDREINAYVSTSHCTLHRISCEHGHDVIKGLLDAHFKHLRNLREARSTETN